MLKVKKNKGKVVKAYELGCGSDMELQLVQEGRIKIISESEYELFSQEAINGKGQVAEKGDYFKVDGSGYPYPNERGWFLENHKKMEGDEYEQIPKELNAWTHDMEKNEEIEYLIKTKKLVVNEGNEENYFEAMLWGTLLSAPQNAIIIVYSVMREEGRIVDVDFALVNKKEFEQTYIIL